MIYVACVRACAEIHACAQVSTLRRYLEVEPSAPLVVVGPDGSGKTQLVKEALQGRGMALHLDLRRLPISNPDEFMYHLARAVGYRLPSFDRLMRLLFKEKGPRRVIEPQEVERFYELLGETLARLRAGRQGGWAWGVRARVPVLAISGLETLLPPSPAGLPPAPPPPAEKREKADKKREKAGGAANATLAPQPELPDLSKFLRFVVYAADNDLAQFVLITSRQFLEQALDPHAAFRSRRDVLQVQFPSAEAMRRHLLEDDLQALLRARGLPPLPPEQLDLVAETLGGCLTDVSALATAVLRGLPLEEALKRQVADAGARVLRVLETLLEEAAPPAPKDQARLALRRHQAVWALLERLAEPGASLPRHRVLRELLEDRARDLAMLEDAGLVQLMQCPLRQDEHRHPCDHSESPQEALRVEAAAPRMRAAFRLLLRDPFLVEQRREIELSLRKGELKADIADLREELTAAARRLSDARQDQLALASAADHMRTAYGPDEFRLALDDATQAYRTAKVRHDALVAELSELEAQLDEVKRKGKKGAAAAATDEAFQQKSDE